MRQGALEAEPPTAWEGAVFIPGVNSPPGAGGPCSPHGEFFPWTGELKAGPYASLTRERLGRAPLPASKKDVLKPRRGLWPRWRDAKRPSIANPNSRTTPTIPGGLSRGQFRPRHPRWGPSTAARRCTAASPPARRCLPFITTSTARRSGCSARRSPALLTPAGHRAAGARTDRVLPKGPDGARPPGCATTATPQRFARPENVGSEHRRPCPGAQPPIPDAAGRRLDRRQGPRTRFLLQSSQRPRLLPRRDRR